MSATTLLELARRRAELHSKTGDHLPFLHASVAWFEALAVATSEEIRAAFAAGSTSSPTTRIYLGAAVVTLNEPDAAAVYAKAAQCWRDKIAEQP